MKKKELQRLTLEKFRISRLNTNSSSRIIGGTILIDTQPNLCITSPELCPIIGNTVTIHVKLITHTCLPDPNQN